ncbi:MAG TPA: peptidase M28, partial [Balneolaceae bacterium]|nr:peptidase M28 [Balneolaceae bacterium]
MKSVKATILSILFATVFLGSTLAQTLQMEVLREIGAAPSAERIEADITTLVEFGTRHTLSDTTSDTRGIGAARRWIKAEFERISADCGGCLEVFYVSDVIEGTRRIPEPTNVVNVVAI